MKIIVLGGPKEGKTSMACFIKRFLDCFGFQTEIHDDAHVVPEGIPITAQNFILKANNAVLLRNLMNPIIIETRQTSRTEWAKQLAKKRKEEK